MFGLFASPGGRGVERRSLAFGPPTEEGDPTLGFLDDVMEVRVFRSKGRRRVVPEVKEYQRPNMQNPAASSKKMAPVRCGNGFEWVSLSIVLL